MNKQILTFLALTSCALVLTGCSASKGAYSGSIVDDQAPVEVASPVGGKEVSGSVDPSFIGSPSAIDDERTADSLLKERVIYFDYDKALVLDEFLPAIAAHSEFLIRNANKGVVLGGHTDERGSNEYNLALGQRRADSVRNLMLSAGVGSNQLEAISFGEEQPSARGSSESDWQQNRRVEIRYTDE